MTLLLQPIEHRLLEIACDGYGSDGSLGPDAQARSIPSGRYRRAVSSLRDTAYPEHSYDRAIWLDWVSQGPAEQQYSQPCSHALVALDCDLLIGHLHASQYRVLHGSESATTRPAWRAHNDVLRLRRALTLALLHGAVAASIEQRAAASIEELGDRLLTTLPLRIVVRASNTDTYDP